MASLYKRITGSAIVTTAPGTIEKIIVGTNTGSHFRLFDGTYNGVLATAMTGSYYPATGSSVIEIEAKFDTALFVQAEPGYVGGSFDYTVLINGDPLR